MTRSETSDSLKPGPIVSVEDLRIRFPTQDRRETVKAVDGVSFAVMPGETFGIIGESGSGKSTLGRAVVCLLKPTEGRVLHGGTDPYTLSSRELRLRRRAQKKQRRATSVRPRLIMVAGRWSFRGTGLLSNGRWNWRSSREQNALFCCRYPRLSTAR